MASPRNVGRTPAGELDWQALFEALPIGLLLQGLDGCVLAVNPAAEELLGLTLEQMRRLPCDGLWPSLLADSDAPAMVPPSQVALRSQVPVRGAWLRVKRPDDQRRWL